MPGDLQLHFAGKKTTKALMPLWIALAANESSGWSIPLKQTKLNSEIALFWKLQKERRDWDSPVKRPEKLREGHKKGEEGKVKSNGQDVSTEKHRGIVANGDGDETNSLNTLSVEGKSSLSDSDSEDRLEDGT